MSHRRSRIRHLKTPFVVTLSVGAGSAGCGGSVTDGEATLNPPACVDDCGGAGGNGGGASAGRGAGTSVGGSTGGDSTGGWANTGGSANTTCPVSAPTDGTPCSLRLGTRCEYGDGPCGSEPDLGASCMSGRWVIEEYYGSCNPPPAPSETCPAVEPTDGDYCNFVPEGACHYGDCSRPISTARCVGGQWELSYGECETLPPDFCPEVEPLELEGERCYYVDGVCDYGDCFGTPDARARCVAGQWEITWTTCNPPPPLVDAGAVSPDGGAADLDGGSAL